MFSVVILFVTVFVLQLPLAGFYYVSWYIKKNLELDLHIPVEYTNLLNIVEGKVVTVPSSCDEKLNTHRISYGVTTFQSSFYLFMCFD